MVSSMTMAERQLGNTFLITCISLIVKEDKKSNSRI